MRRLVLSEETLGSEPFSISRRPDLCTQSTTTTFLPFRRIRTHRPSTVCISGCPDLSRLGVRISIFGSGGAPSAVHPASATSLASGTCAQRIHYYLKTLVWPMLHRRVQVLAQSIPLFSCLTAHQSVSLFSQDARYRTARQSHRCSHCRRWARRPCMFSLVHQFCQQLLTAVLQMMATWMAKCGINTRIVDKRGTKIFNGQADGEKTAIARDRLAHGC